MYLHSVKLINYKSIGDYPESELIIEPKITAIIGKNESGKSNVLEGLADIRFNSNASVFLKDEKANRIDTVRKDIKFIVELKFQEEESIKLNNKIDTVATITKNSYLIEGGFKEVYILKLYNNLQELIKLVNENNYNFSSETRQKYSKSISTLSQKDTLNIYKVDDALTFLENFIKTIQGENKYDIELVFEYIITEWKYLYSILPIIFYRNSDKVLKDSYRIDEVRELLNNPNAHPESLLYNFCKTIQIDPSDFLTTMEPSTNPGIKITLKKKIEKNIEKYVNNEFEKFYSVESINLSCEIETNKISFGVFSKQGPAMLLSERSNGLRWLLNFFIDLKANNIRENNVVFLLDEPGVFLHVNAQKKLLELFRVLSLNNQIIYTTHSPYMLDTVNEGIHRIRAITKDEKGYSYIYKTAYDSRIDSISRKDTLTPVITALGMNLFDTFGPAKNKLNIVVEGLSDYTIIITMAKILETNIENCYFIPSVGVNNCVNLCSILMGWGCPFLILFDYDEEGVKKGGKILSNNLELELNKDYIYTKQCTNQDENNGLYKTNPFRIEELITKEEIDNFIKEKNIDKKVGKQLLTKILCDSLLDGSYICGGICKENFRNLFSRLDNICKFKLDNSKSLLN